MCPAPMRLQSEAEVDAEYEAFEEEIIQEESQYLSCPELVGLTFRDVVDPFLTQEDYIKWQ